MMMLPIVVTVLYAVKYVKILIKNLKEEQR